MGKSITEKLRNARFIAVHATMILLCASTLTEAWVLWKTIACVIKDCTIMHAHKEAPCQRPAANKEEVRASQIKGFQEPFVMEGLRESKYWGCYQLLI